MLERRQKEIELLRRKYGPLEHGENFDWVLFKEFPLPSGWNREKTPLLILIPAGYPMTPPDNFYVPLGFRLASAGLPSNYSEPANHLGRQWGQFSFHADQGRWNPSADLLEGDNLLTFMLLVEGRLKEVN
jgi:Prokaryotic E2 family E